MVVWRSDDVIRRDVFDEVLDDHSFDGWLHPSSVPTGDTRMLNDHTGMALCCCPS